MNTSFPNHDYLKQLLNTQREKVKRQDNTMSELLAYSGLNLNWIGDYLSDTSLTWKLEHLPIHNLWLTGINPEWNNYIIESAERNPKKLKGIIEQNTKLKNEIGSFEVSDLPILIRFEEGKYKILDGMHRVLYALIKEQVTIEAYVAHSDNQFRPQCEAHVVYDLLRSYSRGINRDRDGLIAALKFLTNSYSNVKSLLLDRLGPKWQSDDEIAIIINEVLTD